MRVRPYTEADAEGVVALFASAHTLDPTIRPVTLEAWREFTRRSYSGGARDFAVAEDGRGMAAMLYSMLQESDVRHFRILVHPAHRRAGLGTRILRYVEGQGGTILRCNCRGIWEAGTAFLRHHGFSVTDRQLEMKWRGDVPRPAPVPDGCVLREGRAADDAEWMRLHDDGYAGRPDHTPLTLEDLALKRRGPGFHLWVADLDGRLAGFCETRDTQDGRRGIVESIVVDRRDRGRGLGRALTVAGMRTLREAGHEEIELSVDADNEPAVSLYRSLGIEVYDEQCTWQRPRASAETR
jgi:mycothiol synthase